MTEPSKCLYLGEPTGRETFRDKLPVHKCLRFGECTLTTNRATLPACAGCSHQLTLCSTGLAGNFVDPLAVFSRDNEPTHALRNMLSGGAAFLVCGGPSLKSLPYHRLNERGIFSLGVNNVCGYVRTDAFVCSDPPSKFHWGIISDPKVIKFFPTAKITGSRKLMRRKLPPDQWKHCQVCDGKGQIPGKKNRKGQPSETCDHCYGLGQEQFVGLKGMDASTAPQMFTFKRRSWLRCDESWFLDDHAAWGNLDDGIKLTGEPKTVNTMFLGLRLLQYLGARRVYLLGVDFYMDPSKGPTDNYAFAEHRWPSAITSNNSQYAIANDWFVRLRPVFEQFGFNVYNCNQLSHLRAFDYVPFDQALEDVRGLVPLEPFDLTNWYSK